MGYLKLLKLIVSEVVGFGPHGTGGGSERLRCPLGTPALGRTVEAHVPPTLAVCSLVILALRWLEKMIGKSSYSGSRAAFETRGPRVFTAITGDHSK